MTKKSNPKDVKKGCLIMTVLLGLVVAVISLTCEREELTPAQVRENHINKILYSNGRKSVNIKLMELIQRDLNNPSSMENIELNYIDKDSLIIVKKSFSAKNGFGGRLKKTVIVSIDTLGNITKIIKWID